MAKHKRTTRAVKIKSNTDLKQSTSRYAERCKRGQMYGGFMRLHKCNNYKHTDGPVRYAFRYQLQPAA